MSQPADPGPIISKACFIKGATHPEHYPAPTRPEVAFAGRSNVGKSSLLNVLLDRRRLVRVSRAPGRTREINFFEADEGRVLVDLPGYGYASVSRSVSKAWGPMMETYLLTRESLAGIALLVDARRKPGDWERQLLELAQRRGLRLILIATKVDQIPVPEQRGRIQSIADRLGVRPSWVTPFSKLTRQGRGEVWRRIDVALRHWWDAHPDLALDGAEPAAEPDAPDTPDR